MRAIVTRLAVISTLFCSLAFAEIESASTLINGIASAFTNHLAVRQMLLQGTAHTYLGNSEDSGPVFMTIGADGSQSIDLKLTGGTRKESISGTPENRSCLWTDTDGKVHPGRQDNCWLTVPWLLPALSLQGVGIGQQAGAALRESDAINERREETLSLHRAFSSAPKPGSKEALIARMSEATLSVDKSTQLPTSLTFRQLPEQQEASGRGSYRAFARPALIEIRYFSYQSIAGVNVPTRIEKRVNGALQMSFDIAQAAINN